jgi:hypothetical protein
MQSFAALYWAAAAAPYAEQVVATQPAGSAVLSHSSTQSEYFMQSDAFAPPSGSVPSYLKHAESSVQHLPNAHESHLAPRLMTLSAAHLPPSPLEEPELELEDPPPSPLEPELEPPDDELDDEPPEEVPPSESPLVTVHPGAEKARIPAARVAATETKARFRRDMGSPW